MARRRYLISYDISDPKRLRATFNLMKGYGKWLQYSVFVCDLSKAELAMWERDIHDVIALAYDSVVVIDLGAPQDADIRMLGVPRRLPDRGARGGVSRCETSGHVVSPGERSKGFD